MSAQDKARQEEITYAVRDSEGQLVAVHHRADTKDGKRMWWTLPDGSKGLNGTPLTALPLYGSELVGDYDPDDLIVVIEGEKAAQALLDAGFPALGTVTGAGGTPGTEALEILRGREVALWPDNDDAGREHMRLVAERLRGVACEVRLYEWPEAPEKGDAADHPATLSKDAKAVDRLLNDLMCAPAWRSEERNGHGPETFTASELMALELPPVQWAVPKIVPEGVTLLAGKPKLGKSWLALGLCVAVSAGGFALSKVKVEQGASLYLALEDNQRRLRKRLGKLLVGEAAPAELHIATEWPRLNEGGLEALEGWLEAHPDTRLVVVDTLAKVRPRPKGQNVYTEDYAALEGLLPLASKHGIAIVVVHHLRKEGATDPLDQISGSTGLSGGVDGALVLKRERGRADAFLHVTGREIEEEAELALKWDANVASWTLVGNADEYKMSEERAAVIWVLENADEPLSPKGIAEALDKKDGTMRELLSQMAKCGDVENVGYGKYTAKSSDSPDSPDGSR